MKKTMLVILLVLLGATGFATTAQAATCDDVVYSATMLESNPNIGDACLEVVQEEEISVLKFRASVVRQSVNSTIVQWQLPDGSWTDPDRTYPPYGATARIGGKEVRISDLAPKQEVNVYIVSEGNWTLAEGSGSSAAPAPKAAATAAATSAPAARKAAPAPEPMPRSLPKTATQVPMFALLGGLLILLGGAVSFVRTRL
jgi:LPXTG-motif cell wall-anchored protein